MSRRKLIAPYALSMVLTGLIILSSCKKDVPGCMDETANNYMIEATEDNGSCNYSGEITFWYDNATRDSLLANNIQSVKPFVNNDISTNINTNFVLWSVQPDCKTSAGGRLNIDLGNEKSKLIHFQVGLDGVNNIYWEDSTILQHEGCELYQMIW